MVNTLLARRAVLLYEMRRSVRDRPRLRATATMIARVSDFRIDREGARGRGRARIK